MLPKLPNAGRTNDTNRPDNDIKSFNSPYGERNVGHRGRRVYFADTVEVSSQRISILRLSGEILSITVGFVRTTMTSRSPGDRR